MCLLNNSIFSVKCQSNLQIPTNLFLNFRKELSLILTGKYHLILKKNKKSSAFFHPFFLKICFSLRKQKRSFYLVILRANG